MEMRARRRCPPLPFSIPPSSQSFLSTPLTLPSTHTQRRRRRQAEDVCVCVPPPPPLPTILITSSSFFLMAATLGKRDPGERRVRRRRVRGGDSSVKANCVVEEEGGDSSLPLVRYKARDGRRSLSCSFLLCLPFTQEILGSSLLNT